MRYPGEGDYVNEVIGKYVDGIIFTGRKAKKPYVYSMGIYLDIWIDDQPESILNGAEIEINTGMIK